MRTGQLPEQVPAKQPFATTAGRGYAEALIFYALAFGTFAVTAVLDGAAAWGYHPGWARFADHWWYLSQWSTLAVLTLWFAVVRECRLVWFWAVGIATLIAGYAICTRGVMPTPDGLYQLVAAGTATMLALTLARRHGVRLSDFGIGRGWRQRDHTGRMDASTIFDWSVGANVISAVIGSAITVMGFADGRPPTWQGENPIGIALRILSAGVVEEVLVAVVVIALSAARRPVWEMYALSVFMRVSYHMYYQTVGLSMIAMGIITVWLYRRSRRLTPIIGAHIAYDLIAWAHQGGRIWAGAAALSIFLAKSVVDRYWTKPPGEKRETSAVEPEIARNEATS